MTISRGNTDKIFVEGAHPSHCEKPERDTPYHTIPLSFNCMSVIECRHLLLTTLSAIKAVGQTFCTVATFQTDYIPRPFQPCWPTVTVRPLHIRA